MSEEQEDYGTGEEVEQAEGAEETVEETGEEEEGEAGPEETDEESAEEEKTVPLKAQVAERKKRQEAEERLRAAEARLQELEAKAQPQAPQQPPQTLEELFDANPEETLRFIKDQMAVREAQLEREYDPDLEKELNKLRDKRIELNERMYLNERRRREMAERIAPVEAAIKAVIPDEKKKAEIRAFAIENGLNEKDVDAMLNPAIVGDFAPRAAKMLANLHAKVTNPQTKRVSQAPAPITSVGGKQGAATTDTSKMSDEEWYRHEQERLKQKGRLY